MVTMNDDKIIKNIKERMAISNLEKEYSMNKKGSKKLLLSLLVVFVVAGSLVTVDAVTNGSITNAVKSVIPDIPGFTKTETQTDEGTLVKYERTTTEDGKPQWGITDANDVSSLFIYKLNGVIPPDYAQARDQTNLTQDQINSLQDQINSLNLDQ